MSKALYPFFVLFVIGIFSVAYAQNTDHKILEEYQRIEHSESLRKDSLIQIRGEDFTQGSNADEKRYRLYREKEQIVKMEYEEINTGYRPWKKNTVIYLKNGIPFFITEKTNAVRTLYLDTGERSQPFTENREIFIYDWKNEKFKARMNGMIVSPEYRICKTCFEEMISKITKAVRI